MNDTLEPRVAKLEATVEHIQRDIAEIKADIRALRAEARSDFRLLFAAIIASALGQASLALGLAGLMAHGFHWF